jgi:hypothetical protein
MLTGSTHIGHHHGRGNDCALGVAPQRCCGGLTGHEDGGIGLGSTKGRWAIARSVVGDRESWHVDTCRSKIM